LKNAFRMFFQCIFVRVSVRRIIIHDHLTFRQR
jgi:hypothetical protein